MRIPNCLCNGGHGPDGGLDGPDYWLNDRCPIHGEDDDPEPVELFTAPPPCKDWTRRFEMEIDVFELGAILDALWHQAFQYRRQGGHYDKKRFEETQNAWKRMNIFFWGSIADVPEFTTVILDWDDPAWKHLLEENDPWAA